MNRVGRLLSRAGLPSIEPIQLSGGMMGDVFRCGEWVVKTHHAPPHGLFPAEAKGLRALAATGARVPRVRYADEDGVVMAYLRPGPADPLGLAEAVATVHGARGQRYGWDDAVFLGRFALPVAAEGSRWRGFWAESRVRPLLHVARTILGRLAPRVEALLERHEPPTEGPTLLHGDLWGGNVVMSDAGAALIDPSVWYGERGVDLAMMRLFGGFNARFWAAYGERLPIPREVEASIPFYQLYFLLVHVHFFGAGYCRGVEDVLRRYGC